MKNQKLPTANISNHFLQFFQFFNSFPNPILITDKKARICYVNPAWEKLTGYKFEEVKGKNPRLLNSGKTQKQLYKTLWNLLQKGKSFETDGMIDRRKDGTDYNLHSVFFPIKNKSVTQYYVQIQRTITEQKRIDQDYRIYSIIFQNMAEGIAITTAKDEKIIYTNPKFDSMFGYKTGELKNKSGRILAFKYNDKQNKKKRDDIIAQLNTSGEAHYEIHNIKKDGTPFWCRATASEFIHPTYGKVWITVRTDITKEKQLLDALQISQKQLAQLIDHASDGIFIADFQGRYRNVNAAGANMLGYTPEEIIGKTIVDLIPPEEIERLSKSRDRLLKGATEVGEWRLKRKDGTYMPVEVSAKILPDGRWQGLVRDITERKLIEAQKNAFIGVASHELKTPVTTLYAYAQILKKRMLVEKNTKNLYFIENIINQSKRLTDLIDNLLNVSVIESSKLKLHKTIFDLNALVKKIVIDFQYSTTTHELSTEGVIAANVLGDKDRIEQVLINLLTNAIKYSPKANRVIIHLSQDKKYVQVGVQDFGVGIKKGDQDKIFQRFFRTNSDNNENISGFGLGLYISSQIIQRHNGKVWVESTFGKGSTFFFTLPLTT